jgi:hypothetical protein
VYLIIVATSAHSAHAFLLLRKQLLLLLLLLLCTAPPFCNVSEPRRFAARSNGSSRGR